MRVFGILVPVLIASAARAGEVEDLASLLDQAGQAGVGVQEAVTSPEARAALQALRTRYAAVEGADRGQFADILAAALLDPRPTMRIAAARTLAAAPDGPAVDDMVNAMQAESHPVVQRVLARGIADGIGRLPLGDRVPRAASASTLFDDVIRAPDTDPEVREASVIALGRLGSVSLAALRDLKRDVTWGPKLHAQLPGAFAATCDASAVTDILALYQSDTAPGFRGSCLHALGALLRHAEADEETVRPAVDLLRAIAIGSQDDSVASAACLAYCRWPGAREDAAFAAAVSTWAQAAVGDVRKRYLRSLVHLGAPLDADARVFVETLADAENAPATHRKIADALLVLQRNGT